MRIIAVISLAICASFLLGGCFKGVSSKEIPELEAKCQNGETLNWGFYARFYDFDYAQLDKIEVEHTRDDKTIEAFYVYPEIIERGAKGEAVAQAQIYYRDFNLSDKYQFTVANRYVFTLSDVKMKGYGGGLMYGGYGFMCDIDSYKINGADQSDSIVGFRKSGAKLSR